MALETERKYLVNDASYRTMALSCHTIRQGYITRETKAVVRVRTVDAKGYLTVKGLTRGCTRSEWEYEIPFDDAIQMLREVCSGIIIEKRRYIVPFDGMTWEVDEFGGALAPLVVAEVELENEDVPVSLPPFVGQEVTGNPAYYNSNLQGSAPQGVNSNLQG